MKDKQIALLEILIRMPPVYPPCGPDEILPPLLEGSESMEHDVATPLFAFDQNMN